jgi:hypothetical protein
MKGGRALRPHGFSPDLSEKLLVYGQNGMSKP